MGKIVAVCISSRRGTAKWNVGSAKLVANWGLEHDAHAGDWHRQVSLLPYEGVRALRRRGLQVYDGAFGENLLVAGCDLKALPCGTRLACNGVLLEITQIGKQCHGHCEIYRRLGDCIMPKEGVFARVLRGGTLAAGDEIAPARGREVRVGILTVSDSAYCGKREDGSGPLLRELTEGAGYHVAHMALLPDDRERIAVHLRGLCDGGLVDLVFTTGGTGFSPRDQTPEATLEVLERLAPGIPEAMRQHSLRATPRAVLCRGVAGIRKGTLIINLPGSPAAVRECLQPLLPALGHGMETLKGTAGSCARH